MWPLLSGGVGTSPRQEIPLSIDFANSATHQEGNASALILGEFKLITGTYYTSFRQKQAWPDKTACCKLSCWAKQQFDCDVQEGGACLFNIREDPTETNNLAAAQPEMVKKMKARIAELAKTVFRPQAGDAVDPEAQKAAV